MLIADEPFDFVTDLLLGLFGFMLVTVFCAPFCFCSMCEFYVFHTLFHLLIVSVDSGISFQAV